MCDGVVPAMAVNISAGALFFDVGHFATGRHFAIAANDAPAGQRPKSEEPHETHSRVLQSPGGASSVPLR